MAVLKLEIIDVSAPRVLLDHFFCALKVRFGGQKVSPLSARPKRSCYIAVTEKTVKTRQQLYMVEKGNLEKMTNNVLRGRSAK